MIIIYEIFIKLALLLKYQAIGSYSSNNYTLGTPYKYTLTFTRIDFDYVFS